MKTSAVIVDVDGTLVDVRGIRHHVTGPSKSRDFDAFHTASADCPPIMETITWVEQMADAGHQIIVVTARMERWRTLTQRWIDRHVTRPIADLVMRADRDFRPDYEVKREIHAALTERFDIHHACDDNPSVIQLRNEVGIPVKVIPGWSD